MARWILIFTAPSLIFKSLAISFIVKSWEVRKLRTAINIAGIYAEIGDYDKTAEYNARNLVIAEKLKDSMVLADVYQTINP